MSSLFTIFAPNLKPHSPNMFPTSGVARLNWSLEEWPRSALCEKEEVIPDGNLKINEVRSTRFFVSPVLNHLYNDLGLCIDLSNTHMSKHVKTYHLLKWSAM